MSTKEIRKAVAEKFKKKAAVHKAAMPYKDPEKREPTELELRLVASLQEVLHKGGLSKFMRDHVEATVKNFHAETKPMQMSTSELHLCLGPIGHKPVFLSIHGKTQKTIVKLSSVTETDQNVFLNGEDKVFR